MNIGEASQASGVSSKMIRYYEQTGLIPAADRTSSGYRDYSDKDIHMLRFIRRARDLDFPVPQISELLGLWHDGDRASGDVNALARAAEMERKGRQLRVMRESVEELARRCAGGERPDCPTLDDLATSSF